MNYLYILDFAKTMQDIDQKLRSFIDPVRSSPVFWGLFFLGGVAAFLAVFDSLHKGGK